jgi:hypothetical protein
MMTKMDDENGEDAKIGFFFIQELQVSLSLWIPFFLMN